MPPPTFAAALDEVATANAPAASPPATIGLGTFVALCCAFVLVAYVLLVVPQTGFSFQPKVAVVDATLIPSPDPPLKALWKGVQGIFKR